MNKERYLKAEDRIKFLELISPYMERLRLIVEGKGRLTDKNRIEAYASIFNQYVKDPVSEKLNIGCNSCINASIKQTIGKWDRETAEENKGKKMTFPKQEPKDKLKEIKDKFEKDLTGSGNAGMVIQLEESPKSMKWGAFKKYCTSKGLTVPKKTRKQLEAELKAL